MWRTDRHRHDDLQATDLDSDDDDERGTDLFVRTFSPRDDRINGRRRGGGVSDHLRETAEANAKKLQRLPWSLDEFTFLGRLGASRVSSAGRARFSRTFLRREPALLLVV